MILHVLDDGKLTGVDGVAAPNKARRLPTRNDRPQLVLQILVIAAAKGKAIWQWG